jgi:hypothetical protein
MKRLYIIVEGHTEEEFVKSILSPFFYDKGIYDVRPIKIQTSKGHKGGFVNYDHLKNDAMRLLKKQKEIIVTMFVDFFRIPGSIPNYQVALQERTSLDKVKKLEESISFDINDNRFFPYIQLHEFEALLFSSIQGFNYYWKQPNILLKINKIFEEFPNPEDINDNPNTAPSKRLISIIPEYDKIVYGNLIALEIGINTIIERCPRFKNWIETIIFKVTN